VVSAVFFRRPGTPGDIHHVLRGGRRIGPAGTICLHPWYHRGQPPEVRVAGRVRRLTETEAQGRYGPSLALDRKAFESRFAPELELLAMTEQLLAKAREALA